MHYLAFYGLRSRPFALVPDLAFHFPSEGHRRALACLSHALQRGQGVVTITGEPGVGKTTLIRYLEARLGSRRVLVPRLPAVVASGSVMLRALAAALGPGEGPGSAEPEARAVEAALRARAPQRGSLLLVIDEAQRPVAAALDALRPLLALEGPTGPLLRLVLVGRPELRERLASPALAGLRERVTTSHRLAPLEPEEIGAYVEHRLARAGWQGDPRFDPEAFRALWLATGGLPRGVNQLVTRVLVLAALDGRHELGAEAIEEALVEPRAEPFPEPDATVLVAAPAIEPAGADESGLAAELSALRRRLDALDAELARERRRRAVAEAEVARLRAALRRLADQPPGLGDGLEPPPQLSAAGLEARTG